MRGDDWSDPRVLIRRAKIRAKNLGFWEDAEDIAQTVSMRFHEGKIPPGQTLTQAVIDVVRQDMGDSRTNPARRRIARPIPFSQLKDRFVLAAPVKEISDEFDYYLSLVDGVQRAVLCLYYRWGLDQREIADVFGCTETDVWAVRVKAEHAVKEQC